MNDSVVDVEPERESSKHDVVLVVLVLDVLLLAFGGSFPTGTVLKHDVLLLALGGRFPAGMVSKHDVLLLAFGGSSPTSKHVMVLDVLLLAFRGSLTTFMLVPLFLSLDRDGNTMKELLSSGVCSPANTRPRRRSCCQ